jgi:hypothetical protein
VSNCGITRNSVQILIWLLFDSKDSIGAVVLLQVTRALLFGDGKARVLSVPPPSGGYLVADVANAVTQVSYSVKKRFSIQVMFINHARLSLLWRSGNRDFTRAYQAWQMLVTSFILMK